MDTRILYRYKKALNTQQVDVNLAEKVFSRDASVKQEVYNSLDRAKKVELNFLNLRALLARINLNSQELLSAFVQKVETSGKQVDDLFNGSADPLQYYSQLQTAKAALQVSLENEAGQRERAEMSEAAAKIDSELLKRYQDIARKHNANFLVIEAALNQYDPARKVKPKDPLTVFPFGLTIPKLISSNYPHLIASLEQSETREELQSEIDHLLNMLANNPPPAPINGTDSIDW